MQTLCVTDRISRYSRQNWRLWTVLCLIPLFLAKKEYRKELLIELIFVKFYFDQV